MDESPADHCLSQQLLSEQPEGHNRTGVRLQQQDSLDCEGNFAQSQVEEAAPEREGDRVINGSE
jgi:hypothetical protein